MATVEIAWECSEWSCSHDRLLLTTEAEQREDPDFSFFAEDGDIAVCLRCGSSHEVSVDGEVDLVWVDDGLTPHERGRALGRSERDEELRAALDAEIADLGKTGPTLRLQFFRNLVLQRLDIKLAEGEVSSDG